tara:strand:- start:1799 stop:2086 length:288 start_codon:yes stop_codon:yes gene_type:complete
MIKENNSERSGKSFWSSKRIITVFLIIFGVILGMLLQHYYIEPALGSGCLDDLLICKAQVQVLDEENEACYQQNYDLNRMVTSCEYDLRRYQETV